MGGIAKRDTVCVLLQAGTVRDSMAKSLYSALFDWIVFRINHALLNIKDLVETTKVGRQKKKNDRQDLRFWSTFRLHSFGM